MNVFLMTHKYEKYLNEQKMETKNWKTKSSWVMDMNKWVEDNISFLAYFLFINQNIGFPEL